MFLLCPRNGWTTSCPVATSLTSITWSPDPSNCFVLVESRAIRKKNAENKVLFIEECATNNNSSARPGGPEYSFVQIHHGHKKLLLFMMWQFGDSWVIVINAIEQNNSEHSIVHSSTVSHFKTTVYMYNVLDGGDTSDHNKVVECLRMKISYAIAMICKSSYSWGWSGQKLELMTALGTVCTTMILAEILLTVRGFVNGR